MGEKIKVFFDGKCPLCAREITFYQRQQGANDIDWVDAHKASASDFPEGLTRENALKRFYVIGPKGNLLSGGKGFVLLWMALPKFSFMGNMFNNKYTGWVLGCAYKIFVLNRPWMQRLFSYLIAWNSKHI